MTLEEGNRWKSVWEWRGPSIDDEAVEDDILDVDLTDSSDLDDDGDDDDENENSENEAYPEVRDDPVNATMENAGGVQHVCSPGDAERVMGGSTVVSKTPELLKLKQNVLATPLLLMISGALIVFLLLLCKFLFPTGSGTW